MLLKIYIIFLLFYSLNHFSFTFISPSAFLN
nr:MAG TPA: hypothetical protein [Caudoviricetes sp.]